MRTAVTMCVALLLLVAGCGSTAPAAAPQASTGALDFRGATVDGPAFDGSTLAGTPVVLWFWAPF